MEKRSVIKPGKELDFSSYNDIPPEWYTWILKKRKDPPTEELSHQLDEELEKRKYI